MKIATAAAGMFLFAVAYPLCAAMDAYANERYRLAAVLLGIYLAPFIAL